jgi:hypothetical protein
VLSDGGRCTAPNRDQDAIASRLERPVPASLAGPLGARVVLPGDLVCDATELTIRFRGKRQRRFGLNEYPATGVGFDQDVVDGGLCLEPKRSDADIAQP